MSRFGTCAVLLALLLSAACSGSSDSDDGSGSDALVLGFLNMEDAPAGSFPEATAGAQAAVRYVNDELGGVGGRPLRLEPCTTNGTPESSRACAQRVLEADPVAVVSGIDLGADASVPVITAAGIPYATGSPTLAGELTTSGAYAFTGGTAADLLGIGDHLIERERATSIHVLHEDLPGLLNAAISAAADIFRAKDVDDVKLVAEKADAADFTPALAAATAGNPDAVIVVFPAQSCARILQSARSLGVKATMYYVGACAAPGVVGSARTVERSFFASGFLPVSVSGGGAEGLAFRAGVPAGQRSPVSQASFSAVVNLARLMADGADDPQALEQALQQTRDEPGALAHPYTCDGKQLPLLRSVCNSHVRLLQYRDGAFTDALGEWVTGAKLNELVR